MPFLPIHIGDHVSISAGVSLITGAHKIDDPTFAGTAAPITIEDYVWIGMNATILGGVSIGKGAVVAAGALVWKDVPPFTVVAGTPARAIRRRKLEQPAYQLAFRPLFE
jgi:maltose O-acetyltransferase